MAKKILIIEDHVDTAQFIASLLQGEGFETITAENGQIGVEKTFSEKPDLILLDIMMPVMSGFEVYQKVKSNPATAKIPIIVTSVKVTDKGLVGEKKENLLAEDYIPKPFDPEELVKSVRKHLGA